MCVARIRRHFRAEPLWWTEPSRLLLGVKVRGHEVQNTGPEDLVYQSLTLADWQGCPGIVDLAGADIEQRMGMAQRDFGLLLDLAVRADCLEDQQPPVLFEVNPGGANRLCGEEAFDVAQPTPLTPDQTSEGRGKEEAASSHETQGP